MYTDVYKILLDVYPILKIAYDSNNLEFIHFENFVNKFIWGTENRNNPRFWD